MSEEKKVNYSYWDIKELKAELLKTNQKEEPEKYKKIQDIMVAKQFGNMSKGR